MPYLFLTQVILQALKKLSSKNSKNKSSCVKNKSRNSLGGEKNKQKELIEKE
jgi:hypothetical protein